MRFRGMERVNRARAARKADGVMWDQTLRTDPTELSDNDLWAAIYRVQSRTRTPELQARLEALTAEQRRRRA